MASSNDESRVLTPANIFTFARILLVPVFVVALLSPWPQWFGLDNVISNGAKAVIAAIVFIVISCTDWIDGYLARSRNEVTVLGKFLDPLADKILVAAALIALVELKVIPSWPVLIILTREFIVSGIRMVAASQGYVIAASWYGKAKTVFQIIAIVLFLLKDSLYLPNLESVIDNPLYVISWIVMIIALILTIISMFDYIVKARPILFPKKNESEGEDGIEAAVPPIDDDVVKLAKQVIADCAEKKITVSTAESLTGGMIGYVLTSIPGGSEVVRGGAITYDNEAKHRVLGVNEHLLSTEGAVDGNVAIQMAEGSFKLFSADISVAVTGIAGPTGEEPGKPIGTVFFGVCTRGISRSVRMQFDGNRDEIRAKTAKYALEIIEESLDSI